MKRKTTPGLSVAQSIKDCTDYGKNPVKTEEGKYISAYECDPATVDAEFLLWKSRYRAATGREQKADRDVLCYQIRQSFLPGEITPEDANRIGYELAMRWTKGRHQFIVTTHTDKAHMLAWGLILFIGLIGVLNIINTVYTNIHTRIAEIGTQRAVGMSARIMPG